MSRAVRLGAAGLLVAVLASCAGYLLAWRATGGHWYTVRTPSMGRAAPVGTLLWVEPVATRSLHVGEIISFHPPGRSSTYTHRIVAVDADGTLRTRGDINGAPDSWRLRPGDVIGRVAMRWWGVGWLVRAGPLLILGGLVIAGLAVWATTARWRVPAVMVATSGLLALTVYHYRPLVRGELISFAPLSHGGRATVVSTGLLPARLHAPESGHLSLRDGQVGTIISHHADRHGHFWAYLGPHVPLWWWALLVAVCFAPAVWSATVGRPRPVAA